jgi:hypothetical protein
MRDPLSLSRLTAWSYSRFISESDYEQFVDWNFAELVSKSPRTGGGRR